MFMNKFPPVDDCKITANNDLKTEAILKLID